MKIYRFTPDLESYAHPVRGSGVWWPDGITLRTWIERLAERDPTSYPGNRGRYRASPEELAFSDFPWLSLQVPVMSERAAALFGAELEGRLRPLWIGEQRFFAVQPLYTARGEVSAFVPEASTGIELAGGEIVHYHTRVFEPNRLRGEWFTIPAHQPYAETYVTGDWLARARAAGLTGLDHLELVFDDGPIAPRHVPPPASMIASPTFRYQEECELFCDRGSLYSYDVSELREVFRRAVLDGLIGVT